MSAEDRVTIVTVSFRSEAILPGLLDSAGGAPVVIVDNGDPEGTATRALARGRDGVTVLPMERNLGFGTACNRGAAVAETEFLLFLNPDAELAPGALDALVEGAGRHPGAAGFNPTIVDAKGRVKLRKRSVLQPKSEALADPAEEGDIVLPVLQGSAIFVRKALFDRLGGFDEAIFLYHEDDDLSLRLAAEGPLLRITDARVTHRAGHGSARSPEIAALKARAMGESRVYAMKKHGVPHPWLRSMGRALAQCLSPEMLLSRRKRAKYLGLLKGAWAARGVTPSGEVRVIVPNLKRRWSGVSTTIFRLVPIQSRDLPVACIGPSLPRGFPAVGLSELAALPRSTRRVWHARRNNEMAAGLILRHVLRKNVRLVFTSASQREHTGYTRWLIRHMDRVIATSEKSAAYLRVPNTVIMHGIDCDRFRPAEDKAALREALGLPPERRYAGCYGRVRKQKGVDLFIHAMIPLMEAHPDLDAVVAGLATREHESFLEELRAQVGARGLAGRVHFLGVRPQEDMPDLYAMLDIFVAPQRWEGFGLTPIEAMASGVPAVTSHAGAFEEMVRDGETGYLATTGDAAALSEAIGKLAADPERAATMGRAARADVEERFNITREAAALNAIYRDLLD